MRFFFILILFSKSFFASGQLDTLSDNELIPLFLSISKTDQSHAHQPILRKKIFEANFLQIHEIIKKQGFPSLEKQYRRRKINNCILDASRMTFIHVLQSQAVLMLNESTIRLFKREIEANRLPKSLLEIAVKIFMIDVNRGAIAPLTLEEQHFLAFALNEWQLNP